MFVDPTCVVVAIDAERTFWEKATILHQEAHRKAAIPSDIRAITTTFTNLRTAPSRIPRFWIWRCLRTLSSSKSGFTTLLGLATTWPD